MLKTKKDFMELGDYFISIIKSEFPESKRAENVQILEGWSIFIYLQVTSRLNCQFREWGGNPFYFVVEDGSRKLCQLDLTRLIEENDRYTWYISKPTNKITEKIFDSLFDFYSEIPSAYIEKVKEQKLSLKTNSIVKKAGYLFVKNATKAELKDEFINLIKNLVEYSKDSSNWKAKKVTPHQAKNEIKIFDLEELEAEEGYKQDKVYLYTTRNREIVNSRKELDNYTCQVCGFQLEINGKHIIECHHLNPLSEGEARITNIKDLVSLCPTCHRIVHLRKPPFTIEEAKEIIKEKN